MNSRDNRAAGEVVPPMPKVNSLQALSRLRPKTGQYWCVSAFVLNRDIVKEDGTLDDLHAMMWSFGTFDERDKDKADEHAKNIISITGHPCVIVHKYGTPVPLTLKFDPQSVTEVPVDSKGRLIELESAKYKREREEYERRVALEKDIMKEAEEETDPSNIEHFKRQCYLAIKNRANFQVHSREADAAWQNYKKREMAVRDHFAKYPEHEAQWLPYLKQKLIERGELALYQSMETAYSEIRDELLGLIDVDDMSPSNDAPSKPSSSDCLGGVCVPKQVECSNGVCRIVKPQKTDDDLPPIHPPDDDEDDIIPAEDLPETGSDTKSLVPTTPLVMVNPDFVDDSTDDEITPKRGNQKQSIGRGKQKRNVHH
jgi:hypothetical protein